MHIWVVCQYYKPESGAPSARLSGFARMWLKEGHQVTVLTGIPNHPTGVVPQEYQSRPAFFEEDMDGVTVKRHWLYITKHEGTVKRGLNQLSFALSVLFKNLKRPAEKPDVVMVSSPSFFCVMSGWLLAKRMKVPFVFEVRDLWPGIFVDMGILKPGLLLTILEKMEMLLYRKAHAIVAVTRGFAQNIADRAVDPKKIFVITNGVADVELEKALSPYEDGAVQKLRTEFQINPLTKVVLYIGNHGQAQALGQVVDAARMLMNRSDLMFLMVGDGADKERLKSLARGVPNVHFAGNQPKERVWQFYALADISLVCLKNIPSFNTFIPSKMFEIMASQTAMVACLRGEGAQITQESGGAMVVPPEEPEKLARAIMTLADNPERMEAMGKAGREFVSKNYRHSTLARQYLGVFSKVINDYNA